MTEEWMVSPYLVEVGTQSLPHVIDQVKGLAPWERDAALALQSASVLRMVLDFRGPRWVLMVQDDLAFLRAYRHRRFSLQEVGVDRARAQRLFDAGLIATPASLEEIPSYSQLAIEINTHCNFRCVFCPVATDPLPKKLMTWELYALLLRRASEGGVTSLLLHHYGEPSLDPRLVDRIRLAKDHGLTIELYTNLSRLDENKLRELALLGNVGVIYVNLPTIDPVEFERVMGSKQLPAVLANLRAAVALGLPVRATMNLPLHLDGPEKLAARDRLAEVTGTRASFHRTNSRAGNLDNSDYAVQFAHHGLLNGCYRAIDALPVNVDGLAYLCHQDYHQEYVLGDLRSQSIEEIRRSERAVQLRRWIFGLEEAPADFLCRKCDRTCARSGVHKLAMGRAGLWDTPSREEDPWSAGPPGEPVTTCFSR